jgi:hypothetical protein
MSTANDPASNAAKNQSNNSVDSPVQSCPLQAQWLTLKPLRYGVDELDSEITLPDDFQIRANMPTLSEHKYIVRELAEQYVYLYHPKEHYLLEVHYDSFDVPFPADKIIGRCVFGDPDLTDPEEKNVSTALALSPALLKQKKGEKVVMWLTHAPLTQARIELLEAHPEIIEKAGQSVNLAAAAQDKQDSVFPLFKAKDIIAELAESEEENLLSWTATPLVCKIDEASLTGDHNKETPDNSYGVNLIDPIGITSDLCREFSVAYEMVMGGLTAVQHPLQMAKLTRAIIDNEANKVLGAEFNEVAFRRHAERVKELNQPQVALYLSSAQKEKAQKEADAEFEKNYQAALADRKQKHRQDAQTRYDDRKEKLESVIHAEEMDALLNDNNNGMEKIKDTLDDLAKDWLRWLKHDQLDIALSWLDDTDEEQLPLKEMLVAAMVNNINAVDDGASLVNGWGDNLGKQLEKPMGEAVSMSGIEAHYFLSLGHGATDNTKAILIASSGLKSINGVVAGIRDAVEKNHRALLEAQKHIATPATEVLLETITPYLARANMSTLPNQTLWQHNINLMSLRYGIQFAQVSMKLEDVAWDMQGSYAAMAAVTGNHAIHAQNTPNTPRVRSLAQVTLYDLEQAAKYGDPFTRDQAKYPRVLAKHMKAGEVFVGNSQKLKSAYKAADKLFSAASQTKLVGIFTFMQVFNAMVLYDAMKTDPSFKNKTSYYTALLGVTTTSMALVDKVFSKSFSGESFTGYMKKNGAIAIGKKVSTGLSNSSNVALVAKMLKASQQKQIAFYDRIGVRTAKFVSGAFRFIPILGGIAATFSSAVRLEYDLSDKQNALAVGLSATSFLLNGAALGFLVMAFFFSGPLLMPIAIVLGLLAVGADILRYFFEDDKVTLLLKSAYWGKENYKYIANLGDLDAKEQHFSDLVLTEDIPEDTLKGLTFELRAFCDFLFKPEISITAQSKDNRGYSHFTLNISLPNFIKDQSDISLTVTGKDNKGDKVLASTSAENRWQVNKLQGQLGMEDTAGMVSLTIDERQLEGYAINNTGRASRNNKGTQGMNYHTYNMALEYHQPAGIPISLQYPKITIDDDKWALSFWRNDTEIEHFQLEQEPLDLEEENQYWQEQLYATTQ